MAASLRIDINGDAKAFVRTQAVANHISEADVVRRALEAYSFLETIKKNDGEVVLRRSNGELERLVRF